MYDYVTNELPALVNSLFATTGKQSIMGSVPARVLACVYGCILCVRMCLSLCARTIKISRGACFF